MANAGISEIGIATTTLRGALAKLREHLAPGVVILTTDEGGLRRRTKAELDEAAAG